MAQSYGNGGGANIDRVRFTLSQLIQVIIIIATGLAAWYSLKTDVKVLTLQVTTKLDDHENRIGRLEHEQRRHR